MALGRPSNSCGASFRSTRVFSLPLILRLCCEEACPRKRCCRPLQARERALDPFRFLLIAVAGWMNQHQLLDIDYLREENRILREQLGGRRLRFTDGQRRRLATKAKGLGRKLLAEFATIVTPETLQPGIA